MKRRFGKEAGGNPGLLYRLGQLLTLLALAAPALAGCEPAPDAQAIEPGPTPAATHVDSIFPPEEQMRRFREGLTPVDSLAGGSPDLESLGSRFATAVLAADTAELGRMVLSRSEFAYLYFPTSPFSRPPMRQDPAVTWFLIQQNSVKGITRVLRRFGGEADAFTYRGIECPEPADVQGDNRIRSGCVLRVRWPDGTEERVGWFGSIIERDGRFKLMSYSNDL